MGTKPHPPQDADMFTLYPAIDLRQGRVVRLRQGDPSRQKVYADDPAAIAQRWLAEGARWLHVVNLDGAFGQEDAANRAALQAILRVAARFHAQVQFGGGLRSLDAVAQVLNLGVARVVLGTLAARRPGVVAEALRHWGPARVAVGIDARDGRVQVSGWAESTDLDAVAFARRLAATGLRTVIFTDIRRDGLQTGLALEATVTLQRASGLAVIASGGVATLHDLRAAQRAGLAGVIVGRALYEGTFSVAEALTSLGASAA